MSAMKASRPPVERGIKCDPCMQAAPKLIRQLVRSDGIYCRQSPIQRCSRRKINQSKRPEKISNAINTIQTPKVNGSRNTTVWIPALCGVRKMQTDRNLARSLVGKMRRSLASDSTNGVVDNSTFPSATSPIAPPIESFKLH